MAAPTVPVSAPVLSQKQRRAALKKERRKRKRQALAQARETGLNDESNQVPQEEEDDDEENGGEDKNAEEERQRLHEEWLERERLAQEEFSLKVEREEATLRRREEEERLIKEEWEARQRKEDEEQEQRRQEKKDREEAVQKRLDEAESQLENGRAWMNPEAPVTESSANYGTELDVANCPFFLKTGACRFGDRCSRRHIHPTSSTTLLIRSMFKSFGMEEARRDDYDIDALLEHSEEDLHEHFTEFYHDVLPEFRSVGNVLQFKVSCNYESHLRGNVYVQFETDEQCKEALIKFNGRWYAGRQLQCELCPVTRWKNAICGLFDRQKCPKGKHCNFLHVFRNPGNEFWEADRDLSPRRGNFREGRSERRSSRSWRQRTPPRSERSYTRRDREQQSSASRERWGEERASRSRHSERWSERFRSRSPIRERSRSRSGDRSRRRSHDGDKVRTKSEKRGSRGRWSRSRSRSRDTERHRSSRNSSPKELEKQSSPKEDCSPHQRHKHSKKSKKKKSKKKHKKKSRGSLEQRSSSEESDLESLLKTSPKTEEVDDMVKDTEGEVNRSPSEALEEAPISYEVPHDATTTTEPPSDQKGV